MTSNRLFMLCSIVVCLITSCRKKPKVRTQEEILQLSPFFDVRPSETSVSYIYVPGFQNTELAMGRFCPEFTAITGERIVWRSCAHVIDEPHTSVLFPEIDLRKPTYFSINPMEAALNSIRRDLAPLAQRFMQDVLDFTLEDNAKSPFSVINYNFNYSKANLAQCGDIKALLKTYKDHINKYPEHDVILYGDSRGAATIFNFVALHRPAQVKAAVMEGIFDNLSHVVKHLFYSDKKVREEKRIYKLMKLFLGRYKEHGACPRTCVETIDDTIPLLLVISLKDGIVPAQSAFYLYTHLLARGHKHAHLLVLNNSRHPAYMIDDAHDKRKYETTVHAFYKQYNLPHNSALAQQGQESFELTQPSKEYLEKTYDLPQCSLCG